MCILEKLEVEVTGLMTVLRSSYIDRRLEQFFEVDRRLLGRIGVGVGD
jgi:hypothetical protein